MIYDNPEVVKSIQAFIEEISRENGPLQLLSDNKIPIRDDIFEIIEKECILLYYPLDDDNIKGCHIKKYVNGESRHFVFINTKKPYQDQTWTAAHELGHVLGVDKAITRDDISREDIVNRFAAEVLLPEKLFLEQLEMLFSEINSGRIGLTRYEFMRLITNLMNYFCAPFKAIIRRLVELKYVERQYETAYIEAFKNNSGYYDRLLYENYFTRLGRSKHDVFRFENVSDDIKKIEEKNLASEKVINKYKDLFQIKSDNDRDTTFVVGGENDRKQTKGRS